MLHPVIAISTNQYYQKNNKVQKQPEVFNQTLELSGAKSGRAILARNNISFRNLSEPVEVTHLYNKKTEGKDHLDLPNIHVYEYPDTNLRVMMNIDKNIDNSQILDNPKIIACMINFNNTNFDRIKLKLIDIIIKNKIEKIDKLFSFSGVDSCLMYDSLYSEHPLESVVLINKILTNLKITNEELQFAKQQLNDYVVSDEYLDSTKITKELYEKKELKTLESINAEIKNITVKELENYYNRFKQNSSIEMFITVPEKYFNKYSPELFEKLNSCLNTKFRKNSDEIQENSEFCNNTKLKIIDSNVNSWHYPVKFSNNRDDFLGCITAYILNSICDDWLVTNMNFGTPLELVSNISPKHDNKFYNFNFAEKQSPEHFKEQMNKIIKTDLSEKIESAKMFYKNRLENTFAGNELPEIKNWELCRYRNVFDLYEVIDSIKEEDVKAFINDYFIKQEPIIEGEIDNAS